MKRHFLAYLLLMFTVAACSQASRDSKNISPAEKSVAPNLNLESTEAVTDESTTDKSISNSNETLSGIDFDKKIIKNATVLLEVKNNKDYAQKMKDIIKKHGAYISKEENYNTEEKVETVLGIRVPVPQFEGLINELAFDDARQLERSVTSEDITGQMIDVKARLEAKKATREKYLEFLKQGKTVEDVLRVQAEINNIQEQIESAESRLAYLSNQTQYSTITLTYFEPKSGYEYNGKPSFLSRIGNAFINGGKWFVDLLIAIIAIWPFWLAIAIIWLVIRQYRKNKTINKNV
jgi:tellurite resistance protein